MNIELGPADTFLLTIPSPTGGAHTVSIPASEAGLRTLRNILASRSRADTQRKKIGHDASPTQSMIEAWLREETAQRAAASGIDLDKLEINI